MHAWQSKLFSSSDHISADLERKFVIKYWPSRSVSRRKKYLKDGILMPQTSSIVSYRGNNPNDLVSTGSVN
jgi:hypothetical protein